MTKSIFASQHKNLFQVRLVFDLALDQYQANLLHFAGLKTIDIMESATIYFKYEASNQQPHLLLRLMIKKLMGRT